MTVDHASPPRDKLAEGLILAHLVGVTFLQKIVVPIGGTTQIFLGLFLMLGTLILGLLSGRLAIRPGLLFMYLVMTSCLAGIVLVSGNEFSPLSLTLLLFLMSLYVFRIKSDLLRPNIELVFFQKIALFLAALGIVQFLGQFLIGVDNAFFLDGEAFKSIVSHGYNNLNRLSPSAVKPNAVFLLEPATFSKLVAISIIVEITVFKRLKRIAFLFIAEAFTFSGTGLLILLLLLPLYLFQKRQFHILAIFLVFLATAPYWAPVIGLDRTIDRIHEFSQPGTSGYARFVSIFPILRDHILPHPNLLFLGMGAGSMESISQYYDYEVHPPSWGKLWMEYGLIGLLAALLFIIPAIWSGSRSVYLKLALTILMFYDNYILVPSAHGLILALLAWPSANAPAAPKGTAGKAETVVEAKA